MQNSFYYEGHNPTVDLVLIDWEEKKVLLIQRDLKSNACPGMWAFPGGFIDTLAKKHEKWKEGKETPLEAALRELHEETGISSDNLDKNRLIFKGIYEGNHRDPRDNDVSWSQSHVFYYLLNPEEGKILESAQGLDDAMAAKAFSFSEVERMKLAFDHNQIFEDILKDLNNKQQKKVKP